MSHMYCPQCGAFCIDTTRGFISGCVHHPADIPYEKLTRRERELVTAARRRLQKQQATASKGPD